MIKNKLILAALCLLTGRLLALDEAALDKKMQQFSPLKPCVQMRYEVSYRFMGLTLMKVAEARVQATEGVWINEVSAENLPACVLDMTIQSPGVSEEDRRDRRVYLDNRVLSVVTMPDINTLFYMKQTDEVINPFFKKPIVNHNTHLYDLQSGALDFYSINYTTGAVSTNLDGAADFVSQGREVSGILKLMSDILKGHRGLLTPEDNFRISVNLEGRATPFTAETHLEQQISRISDEAWEVLRIEVMPAPEAEGVRRKKFAMWATSLEQIAARSDDETLKELAVTAPEWGLAPLSATMGLPLGYIRCELVEVKVLTSGQEATPAPLPAQQQLRQPDQ